MLKNIIPLEEGVKLTARCRIEKDDVLAPAYQNQGIIPTCISYERAAFEEILSDPTCTGLRIYTTMDKDQKIGFVICGVNSANEDLFITTDDGNGPVQSVLDNGTRCPLDCPPDSPLNS